MNEQQIIFIDIDKIHPHPENPRKDLGDVSELAESIKKNGIMQNLTITPIEGKPGEYTAIIGHRRHAAAKQAGIKELPCRIVEGMSEKEQVSTMLEENMQRNDLTIYEQAQGFQLMLDLGETEDTIAQKTGFSKTTIRHRLNIAKLDQKALQKKEKDDSFQLSLKDLYALEQVENIKTRNKILKEAGSSRDLIWKAQSAAAEEKKDKKIKQIAKMLEPLGVIKAPDKAKDEQWSGKWELIKEIDLEKEVPKKIQLKETDPLFYLPYYRSVRIIKKAKNDKKDSPEEARRKQKERDKKAIKVKLKAMDASRKEFIQSIISGKIDAVKNENDIREQIWKILFEAHSGLYPSSLRRFFIGKEEYKCTEEEVTAAQKKVDSLSFTHSMLIMMHHAMENIGEIYDWQGYYNTDRGITLIHAYEILSIYGWTFPNDDDEKLLDGTHQLYVQKTES